MLPCRSPTDCENGRSGDAGARSGPREERGLSYHLRAGSGSAELDQQRVET